ncbi:Appr-1-p processing protein, partial [Vibrio anguillarum]|nr:Appr-1-p processing protein [Vibrio anguillarum]
EKVLQLVPGAVKEAQEFLDQHPDTRERFEKVSRLVEGFESPQGLELLATVHWLNRYEQAKNTEQVIKGVHSWNARKQQFTPRQITIAEKVLDRQHWLSV